jgi:hypothetical protein
MFLIASILFTLFSWFVAWTKILPLYEHSFVLLWLGYIATINSFSGWLLGKSLIQKMGWKFLLLFVISIPFWWFFEFLNLFVRNWSYVFPRSVGSLEYAVYASISFSTVVPAVLSTSFLFYHLTLKVKKLQGLRLSPKPVLLILSILAGFTSLVLIVSLPYISFPLLWLGVFLITEPINIICGFPSFGEKLKKGDWTLLVSVPAATVFTGFWWELWNFYSMPKWVYHIPYVGFFKIFEMPILGFLGYPFFGLEVYSFAAFVLGVLRRKIKFNSNFLLD